MDQNLQGNSKLKAVIAKCKTANMPNDTINNAIKKLQQVMKIMKK